MKAIRFYMSNKEEFLFDEETAEMILDQQNQIVRIADENGKWTGQSVNKAHIICTKIDWGETRHLNRKSEDRQIEAPEKNLEHIRALLKDYRPDFLHEN